MRLEKIISKELVTVNYDMFMKEDGPSSRKWECNGNRMSQLMDLSNPNFFGSMDFRVFMRLLRECFQKLKSRIELERKTVVENKVCDRISRHSAVLDQTALGDCVSDRFNVNDVSDLQLRSR